MPHWTTFIIIQLIFKAAGTLPHQTHSLTVTARFTFIFKRLAASMYSLIHVNNRRSALLIRIDISCLLMYIHELPYRFMLHYAFSDAFSDSKRVTTFLNRRYLLFATVTPRHYSQWYPH